MIGIQEALNKAVEDNRNLEKENKRLSKIIYEYEKWLIERVSDGSNIEENHIYVISLKKLQELKEGKSDESKAVK